MRFNPDADLDTTRFEWLYRSPNNSLIENVLIDIQPLTERLTTMVDMLMAMLTAFVQGAVVFGILFAILAVTAMRIDGRR